MSLVSNPTHPLFKLLKGNSYKKKVFSLYVRDYTTVYESATQWSGGSKSSFFTMNKNGLLTPIHIEGTGFPTFSGQKTINLDEVFCVVELCVSGGKESIANIRISQEKLDRLMGN